MRYTDVKKGRDVVCAYYQAFFACWIRIRAGYAAYLDANCHIFDSNHTKTSTQPMLQHAYQRYKWPIVV